MILYIYESCLTYNCTVISNKVEMFCSFAYYISVPEPKSDFMMQDKAINSVGLNSANAILGVTTLIISYI